MTDKEAFQEWCKEILPIVQGAANGEDVEMRIYDPKEPVIWRPKTTRCLANSATYRLKPKPQYRPYTPQEALEHTHKQIVCVDSGECLIIGFIGGAGILSSREYSFITYTSLVAFYVFKDTGLPCGVLVQESSNA